ncbi:hypothetical protein BLOT_002875 [Blomia tropicalis]|nr:hypothetical protein BLOT_002875 [Blomia tropicalis]
MTEPVAEQILKFKKPKIVFMDVSGTLTQGTFIPSLLIPYFKKNHRPFLEENIEKPIIGNIIFKLRASASMDAKAPKIAPDMADKSILIDTVSNYVDHCLDNFKENKPLILYRFVVWFDGYDRGLLQTPVYNDVAVQLHKWFDAQGIRLFILSNGWSVATKKFLEKTTQGNLSNLIQDFLDTEIGPLNHASTFHTAIDCIQEHPKDIIYLTKNGDSARAAIEIGIVSILVLTHQRDVTLIRNDPRDAGIPHVRTLKEIEFE